MTPHTKNNIKCLGTSAGWWCFYTWENKKCSMWWEKWDKIWAKGLENINKGEKGAECLILTEPRARTVLVGELSKSVITDTLALYGPGTMPLGTFFIRSIYLLPPPKIVKLNVHFIWLCCLYVCPFNYNSSFYFIYLLIKF